MGFSYRWLVSLTKGDRHRRMSMHSVSCKISVSKDLQKNYCIFPEKELCL